MGFSVSLDNKNLILTYINKQTFPIKEQLRQVIDESERQESLLSRMRRCFSGIFPSPQSIGQLIGGLTAQGIAAEQGPPIVRSSVHMFIEKFVPGLSTTPNLSWWNPWSCATYATGIAIETQLVGYCMPLVTTGAGFLGAIVGGVAINVIIELGKYLRDCLFSGAQRHEPRLEEWDIDNAVQLLKEQNVVTSGEGILDLEKRRRRHAIAVEIFRASSIQAIDEIFQKHTRANETRCFITTLNGHELSDEEVKILEKSKRWFQIGDISLSKKQKKKMVRALDLLSKTQEKERVQGSGRECNSA